MRICSDCKDRERKWNTSLCDEKCTNKHCENYIEMIIVVRKKIIKKPLKQMSITFYYNQNIATA
jgi:hypothetical protein